MSAELDYPFSDPPAAGTLCCVATGIHWLRLGLPWRLDHINLWLLDDAAGPVLVDTGLGDEATRTAWGHWLASALQGLSRILITHYHPDHLGNAAWLAARTGAPIAMALGELLLAHAVWAQLPGFDAQAMLAQFRSHGLSEELLTRLAGRGNIYPRGVPELPAQIQRLSDGDELHIGGRRWHAISGQGHSPEHLAFHCAEAGVLIAGDMLLPRISTHVSVAPALPEEDAVGRYLASVQRFASLPEDTLVLPAHGLPFRGLHARIGQLLAHHAERDARMCAALQQPAHAAGLLDTLFQRRLDAHQLMFAMSEAIAHLNHATAGGRLRRLVSPEGLIRYQAC